MKKKIFYLIPLFIVLGGILIMMLLFSFKTENPKKKSLVKGRSVEFLIAEFQDNESVIEAYGRMVSTSPIMLISEAEGTILSGEIPFQPGQSFSLGDTLLKIDDRQIRLDINTSKSDFMNAIASVLPEIKLDFPQDFSLWENYFKSISFSDILPLIPETENQKIKLFLTRFNVYKLYFSIKKLEIKLEKHNLVAEFNGTIIKTQLRAGSTARMGTQLGEIISLDDMEIEVAIPTEDFAWIDRSKTIKLTTDGINGIWSGRIKRISSSIDMQTQSVPVYLSVNSQGTKLLDGLFWKAEIQGKTVKNSFSVPRKALYEDKYLYTIVGGKLKLNEIQIARREKEKIIINGGIAQGDTVITEVMQGVVEGMPVRPLLQEGGGN